MRIIWNHLPNIRFNIPLAIALSP